MGLPIHQRFTSATFVVVFLATFISAAKNDVPYTMTVEALKGPNSTDFYATITSDGEIPDIAKKMQVKVRDENGDVIFVHNLSGVAIVDNMATISVPDPAPQENVRILVHLKPGKKEYILKSSVDILLRPDLIWASATAPEAVIEDEPFDLQGVIHEANLQVGATANVDLYDNVTLLATVSGVSISAGGAITVMFQGVTLSGVGTHDLTLSITGAAPGEYDDTNNTTGLTIEVESAGTLQTSYYSLSYSRYNDYNYTYLAQDDCGYFYSSDYVNNNFDNLSMYFYSYGEVLTGTLTSVSVDVYADGVLFSSLEGTNITGDDYGYFRYYSLYDLATQLYLSIYSYDQYAQVEGSLWQFSGEQSYVYSYLNGTTYTYTNSTQNFMAAQQNVTVNLSITDGNLILGGTATAPLGQSYHYVANYTYDYGGQYCNYRYTYDYDYYYAYAYGSGTLDPAGLGKQMAYISMLPDEVRIAGNYPNPFNPTTMVTFDLPNESIVELRVYDMIGREVATLVRGYRAAGQHEAFWNGLTTAGARVPSGIYFARLQADGITQTHKMVLLK